MSEDDLTKFYGKNCDLTYKTNYDQLHDGGDDLPEDWPEPQYNHCPRCSKHTVVKVSMIEKLHDQGNLSDVHPNLDYYSVGTVTPQ